MVALLAIFKSRSSGKLRTITLDSDYSCNDMSYARLDVWSRAQICALRDWGVPVGDVRFIGQADKERLLSVARITGMGCLQ